MRIVTVRSDHEITRVRDRHPRVSPTIYSSLHSIHREALEGLPTKQGNIQPQHPYPRKVPSMLPESTPGTCQSHSALFVKRRQPPDASGERTEPSHPGPRMSHPMVQGIPSPPTRDRPPPPSRTTQAHERHIAIINITASRSQCLRNPSQLGLRGLRTRCSAASQAELEDSGAERAGMATVSGRSSGEGSQRSSRCRLRARWPALGRAGRGLHVLCAGRRWALSQVVRRADLQLDVLRVHHAVGA